MILDGVIVEPLEPFESDELTVSDKAFDAAPAEQPDEPLHDINPFLVIGVPPFGQQPEQDGERHVVVRYAQHQCVDIESSQLPVGAVHRERVWAVERDARPEVFRNDIKIQHQLRHEALDAAGAGLPGSLVAKRPGQLGQADRLHGAERPEQHGKAFDVGKIHRRFENR